MRLVAGLGTQRATPPGNSPWCPSLESFEATPDHVMQSLFLSVRPEDDGRLKTTTPWTRVTPHCQRALGSGAVLELSLLSWDSLVEQAKLLALWMSPHGGFRWCPFVT